jgi:hypothetical protein
MGFFREICGGYKLRQIKLNILLEQSLHFCSTKYLSIFLYLKSNPIYLTQIVQINQKRKKKDSGIKKVNGERKIMTICFLLKKIGTQK